MPVYVDHGVSSAPNAQLWVAIRPEQLLQIERPAATDNWAHGTIKDIAYMGDLSILIVRLDSGTRSACYADQASARKPEERLTWDDEVYLVWDSAAPVVGAG